MAKGFDKIKIFNIKDIRNIAGKYLRIIDNRIFEKYQDKDGRTFKPYTENYRKRKQSDYRKKDGSRYKGYEEGRLSTQIMPANFQLTYKTRFNLKGRGETTSGFKVGWDGEPGVIVLGNAERGRDIWQSIPQKEANWIADEFRKVLDKEFRQKIKDTTIRVGR